VTERLGEGGQREDGRNAKRAQRQGWYTATRELAVAAGLVLALTGAAWLLFGPETASIVVLACVALGLAALRVLLGARVHPPNLPAPIYDAPSNSFVGFWRTQSDLADAIASMSAYDLTTRRRLQNLLAARLSERHGISLAQDPAAARAVFVGADGAAVALWFWVDPERQTPDDAVSRRGIPPRALAALIQRLEQL
jgi:hypothetical protein